MTYLIVGLGNPGKEYENTRHNLGFLVVDEMIERYDAATVNTQLQTKLWTAKLDGATELLAKPQTFMNLSGNAVAPLVRTKKIATDHLVIIHDDLDLAFGRVRVSRDATAAGHNGVQSVIDSLGTKDFTRVRAGIGRPTNDQPIEDYVLTRFSVEEKKLLPEIIDKSIKKIIELISGFPLSRE